VAGFGGKAGFTGSFRDPFAAFRMVPATRIGTFGH
jgi:hypothetical protein